jgi:hypothetical protein
MDKQPPLDFESAQERTDYIRDNADYFTVTFRSGLKNHTFEFQDLETARMNAVLASLALQRPVMIYAVLYPYDTWLENVFPDINSYKEMIPKIAESVRGLRNRRQTSSEHE